jgi:hypothetical protein
MLASYLTFARCNAFRQRTVVTADRRWPELI